MEFWGGQLMAFFTLHSDQSFLNTPERHDSRIGTHPVKKEQKTDASEQNHSKALITFH